MHQQQNQNQNKYQLNNLSLQKISKDKQITNIKQQSFVEDMDPQDLLDSFRQSYFLGNYAKILEKWNQTDDEQFGQHIQAVNFTVARAITYHKLFSPKHQIQFTKSPSQQLIAVTEAVNKYLSPLTQSNDSSFQQQESEFKQMSQLMRDVYNQSGQNVYFLIIGCYLALAGNDLAFFTTNEAKFRENYELLYLYILVLLKNNKLDQADAKLQELRKMNDEDVLTLLATIHILVKYIFKRTLLIY